MSYNPEDLTRLKHVIDLATRIKNYGYQTEADVNALINVAITTAYKAGGSKAPAELLPALLIAGNEGKVYNVSAAGTTDANFLEGSGHPYSAGADVAVINVGTTAEPSFKFNLLPGIVDMSGKADKVASPTASNLLAMDEHGNLSDAGAKIATDADVDEALDTLYPTANQTP